MSEDEKYPECKKRSVAMPKIRTLVEFLEWMEQNNLHVCSYNPKWSHSNYQRTTEPHEKTIHNFLGIDDAKLEKERQEIIEGLQRAAEKRGCHE